MNAKSQFVNGGLYLQRLISWIVFQVTLLLWDINVKFNWILKEHTKFVSEAYLSYLSLDEDQMPHDLQPGLEKT